MSWELMVMGDPRCRQRTTGVIRGRVQIRGLRCLDHYLGSKEIRVIGVSQKTNEHHRSAFQTVKPTMLYVAIAQTHSHRSPTRSSLGVAPPYRAPLTIALEASSSTTPSTTRTSSSTAATSSSRYRSIRVTASATAMANPSLHG